MSKFFDFCNKHGRFAYLLLFCAIALCYCFPLHVYAVVENGVVSDMFSAPFIVTMFRYYPPQIFNISTAIFFALASIMCFVLFFIRKRHFLLPFIPLALAFIGTIICPITLSTNPTYYAHLNSFDWNSIVLIILIILYIVYLLLRRYYAPVKARIQASRAERQANRKPTKDERIAELERKVAELESKNKDEQ